MTQTACKDCPHIVGDSYQRDCDFPNCVGGWEQAYKNLQDICDSLKAESEWVDPRPQLPTSHRAVEVKHDDGTVGLATRDKNWDGGFWVTYPAGFRYSMAHPNVIGWRYRK